MGLGVTVFVAVAVAVGKGVGVSVDVAVGSIVGVAVKSIHCQVKTPCISVV